MGPTWTVGELARRTGLSVRTLHHYDAIGLLRPSGRSPAGYRLYAAADVQRLQQIRSLRAVGLPLREIRDALSRPDFSPLRAIELHVARLREQIALQQKLCGRLEAVAARLASVGEVSAEELITTIEVIVMSENLNKYYTPEQLEQIQARGQALGPEGLRQAESDWAELMDQVRAEMARGTDPADPRVQALARRWQELIRGFTGGDPGIEQGLRRLWHEEQNVHGIDTAETREMGAYVQRALEAGQA